MGLDIVLNEVSLINAAHDIPTSKQLMSDLFDTIVEAASVVGRGNLNIEVCTPRDLSALSLAPEYAVGRWLNDRTVDERQRRLFLAIATKKPYIDDIAESSEEEFLFRQMPVKSLGYAFIKEALAVSLRAEPCWDRNHLELEHHRLDEAGGITVELVDVIHASRIVHVQDHSYWIRSSIQAGAQLSISDGNALWKRREELFPHLLFCSVVETQLQQILSGSLMLKPVIKKLLELERFCKDWLDGPFDYRDIACTISSESSRTLQEYGQERTFLCHDGNTRTFSWHVKLTPNAWRIYFYPSEDERQLIIGYIGRHLSTVKYPT
jgi:hypothetical protein